MDFGPNKNKYKRLYEDLDGWIEKCRDDLNKAEDYFYNYQRSSPFLDEGTPGTYYEDARQRLDKRLDKELDYAKEAYEELKRAKNAAYDRYLYYKDKEAGQED